MQLLFEIGTIGDVLNIDAKIPEFDGRTTKHKIEEKLMDKAMLILIAKIDDKPIAYKMGYALSETEFYSWLGGVIPAYRNQGIATKLREKQESWALNSGYQKMRVKSMNCFPVMLRLLIAAGYYIDGYQEGGNISKSKISFVKVLANKA